MDHLGLSGLPVDSDFLGYTMQETLPQPFIIFKLFVNKEKEEKEGTKVKNVNLFRVNEAYIPKNLAQAR